MAIYEKFVGASRDDFISLKDVQRNYNLTYNDNFNFAYDVLDVLGNTQPEKLAMVYVNDEGEEKKFTFRDMMLNSNKAANYLKYLGIKKGDRVLLVMRRSYYFWFCLMGLHKIGAIAVQATDMLKTKDYLYRCNAGKLKAAIITGHGNCTEEFDGCKDQYETIELKLVLGHKKIEGWLDFEEGFAMASDKWQRPTGKNATKVDDTMLMAFSSGTTGYPKIISHNFKYPLGHIMTGVFWHRVVDGGLHFTVADTGWAKALWGKCYGQWFGESAIMVYDFERFNAKNVLSIMEKYKVTTFCVPPTMYRMLLEEDVASYDLSSLTHCCSAGEALNPEIFNNWKKATGHMIYEGFGQTETPLVIAELYPWTDPVPGALGFAVPGFDVYILDSDNNQCQRGTTGEISIRVLSTTRKSCGLIDTYNFSKEDTANAMYGGYYHTGDTAYRDEQGIFRYVGRNDDVIKSSGYRIGPFEIESVLLEHDAVREVAVTGVPDPMRGFVVKAAIVLNDGYEGTEELTKELQNYVKKNTAPYKYPRIVEYVDDLPKTFNGKIKRSAIREMDAIKYGTATKK